MISITPTDQHCALFSLSQHCALFSLSLQPTEEDRRMYSEIMKKCKQVSAHTYTHEILLNDVMMTSSINDVMHVLVM